MPKERKGRINKQNRVRPTGLPTLAEAQQAIIEDGDSDVIETGADVQPNIPIFQKLKSAEEADREVACNGLANLVLEEDEAVRLSLEEGSLKTLVSCLADPSLAVRIAATGALNNLSTVAPVAAFPLLHHHCTATLLGVLQQNLRLVNDASSAKSEEEVQQLCSLLAQTISLLSNLSESSEAATTMILQAGALSLIISFLQNPQAVPPAILLASAGLLQVLTDCDNDRLLNQWLSAGDRESLVKLLLAYLTRPDPDVRFASLLAGSVVNMGGGRHPDIIRALMSVLDLCWKFDGLAGLVELSQYLQQAQQQEKIMGSTVNTAEEALEKWRTNMGAQQAGFEILTNICSSIEAEAAEKEEVPLADDEEETVDESQLPAGSVNMDEATAIAPEVLAALPLPAILAKVVEKVQWDRTRVTALGQTFGFMQKCVTHFHDVQARALSCLNNMLLVLPLPADKQQAEGLWELLVKLCVEAGQPLPPPLGTDANMETLELVTASMWTLLRKSTQHGFPLSPHTNVVEGMVQLAAGCPSFVARANALGCLGIMGQHPQLVDLAPKVAAVLVHSVGTSLMAEQTAATTPGESWSTVHGAVVAEGLNSLFDMFSEEDKDHIFAQLALLPKLRSFSPLLRNKIRQESRALDRDLLERLRETKLNLDRFIQYKAQHLKQ